jgi:hypothetical protein
MKVAPLHRALDARGSFRWRIRYGGLEVPARGVQSSGDGCLAAFPFSGAELQPLHLDGET